MVRLLNPSLSGLPVEAQKSAMKDPLLHQFFLIFDDLSALTSYGENHSPVNERSCIGVSRRCEIDRITPRTRPTLWVQALAKQAICLRGHRRSKQTMHSLATAMPPLTRLVRIFTIPNCSMRHSRVWDSANVAMGCSRHSRISTAEPCGNQFKEYRFSHETWC